MTAKSRITTSQRGCAMAIATPLWQNSPRNSYSIVQDYLGIPIQALDSKGEVVWDCILDIYGDVLENSEARGTSYLLGPKDNMKTKKQGFIIIGTPSFLTAQAILDEIYKSYQNNKLVNIKKCLNH